MTAPTVSRLVAVDELRRAWAAVQAGQFRTRRPPGSPPRTSGPDVTGVWTPAAGEQVLPVLGCAGSVGATVLAVALATAHEGPARVVECASASATGLAAASRAELGATHPGWVAGSRDQVLLQRADRPRLGWADVPCPAPGDAPGLTVVDVAHPLEALLAGSGWLPSLVRRAPRLVFAARASVPGLRRLESCLHLVDVDRVIACVLGPVPRRWPRDVTHSLGPLTRALVEAGRLVDVPEDRTLAVHGLTPAPLPTSLRTTAATVLLLTKGPSS